LGVSGRFATVAAVRVCIRSPIHLWALVTRASMLLALFDIHSGLANFCFPDPAGISPWRI
jgi:hypothetical protein